MDRYRMLPSYHYYDVEGTSPLALEKSVGKPLRDYKIYGNSIQDGTPTPDNPVEVQSCGDKTINLLNPIFDDERLWAGAASGSAMYTDNGVRTKIVPVKPNTTYTISGIFTGMNSNAVRMYFTEEYPTVGVTTVANRVDANAPNYAAEYVAKTFVTPENCNYLMLATGSSTISDYTDNKIQLSEGLYALYEPYAKYKIPIKLSQESKNLASPQAMHNYVKRMNAVGSTYKGDLTKIITDEDGREILVLNSVSGYGHVNREELETLFSGVFKENTNYTISFDYYRDQASKAMNLAVYFTGGSSYRLSNQEFTDIPEVNKVYHCTITMWVSSDRGSISEIRKTYQSGNTYIYLDTLQLEEGYATDYEPYKEPIAENIYLDEALADGEYIDYINQKIVRANGETDIELPPILTLKGTNIVSVDTEIQPSKISLQYYK